MRKWLSGSVVDDPDIVLGQVFDQAAARDPAHARPWPAPGRSPPT
jgi:hypothetical protein